MNGWDNFLKNIGRGRLFRGEHLRDLLKCQYKGIGRGRWLEVNRLQTGGSQSMIHTSDSINEIALKGGEVVKGFKLFKFLTNPF